jgi:hypothetical protein
MAPAAGGIRALGPLLLLCLCAFLASGAQAATDCGCPKSPKPTALVCGVDGVSRASACAADCAGVAVAYRGSCLVTSKSGAASVAAPTTEASGEDVGLAAVELQAAGGGAAAAPAGEGGGDAAAADEGCFCIALWEPVCETATGRTYGNSCAAGCADAGATRPGECA